MAGYGSMVTLTQTLPARSIFSAQDHISTLKQQVGGMVCGRFTMWIPYALPGSKKLTTLAMGADAKHEELA